MLKTIEAIIDTQGHVRLLERVKLGKKHKALVTILDEEEFSIEESIVGSIELLDEDLEGGSLQIAEMFNQSLENSGESLRD